MTIKITIRGILQLGLGCFAYFLLYQFLRVPAIWFTKDIFSWQDAAPLAGLITIFYIAFTILLQLSLYFTVKKSALWIWGVSALLVSNIAFYPLFWLQRAAASSQPTILVMLKVLYLLPILESYVILFLNARFKMNHQIFTPMKRMLPIIALELYFLFFYCFPLYNKVFDPYFGVELPFAWYFMWGNTFMVTLYLIVSRFRQAPSDRLTPIGEPKE